MRTQVRLLTRALLLVAVPALALACGSEPLGPAEQPAELEPPADVRTAAVPEKGEYLLAEDITTYFACLGEDVRFQTLLRLRYHQVLTPSGNFNYMDIVIDVLQGEAVGLVSGTKWTYANSLQGPLVIHSAKGSVFNLAVTFKLQSDDGRQMLTKNRFHFTVDANGVPRATTVVVSDCRLIGPS